MKKYVILTAIISLFLVTAVSAQDKAIDFSGNWELDANKSKLGERTRIESMTMNVSQIGMELKVETTTKYAFRSEGETRDEKTGTGMIRKDVSGSFGDTTEVAAYSLEGREIKSEIPGIPIATTTHKTKWEKDGKLHLTSSRPSKTPKGAMTIKETWTLSADGKTLTVLREQETPQGNLSAEMVFNKK